MIASISKPKLPKSLAYPLKSSQLAEAISAIECHLDLNYVTNIGSPILRAWYWLPNEHVSHDRVYVTTGVVPANDRSAANNLLTSQILPAFARWIQRCISLPPDSTQRTSELIFTACFLDGAIAFDCHPAE